MVAMCSCEHRLGIAVGSVIELALYYDNTHSSRSLSGFRYIINATQLLLTNNAIQTSSVSNEK